MTYHIYHIPGIKIGCTSDLQKRMSDQGFTDWEILEEHTDIYEVSHREIELQKEYSLPVDDVPYHISVNNRYKWTSETGRNAGRKGGATNVRSGHWASLKTKEHQSNAGKAMKGYKYTKVTCNYCGKEGGGGNMKRYHFDNCNYKK